MSQSLGLDERVSATIGLGESHFREFKSAYAGPPHARGPRQPEHLRRDIGETLVAFANADGGVLLVGVEDDGVVSGVPHPQRILESFLRAPTEALHPETPVQATAVPLRIGQDRILFFAVDKSTEQIHLTSDGRCLQRRDRANIPTPVERIQFERRERVSREYDRQYTDGATVNDLDTALLRRLGSRLGQGLSDEKLLQLLELADFDGTAVRLRKAALLLFAKDVTKWHTRCGVRVFRVAGTELKGGRDYNATDKVVFHNILELIPRSWELLRPHLVRAGLVGGLFEEQVLYPEDACLEALVNAIAHRDYSTEGRSIEVFVFDDRIEVRSPGALLATVTLESLTTQSGLHESRNSRVARVLKEAGHMREVGEGLRRVYVLMKQNDLVPPELTSSNESFAITLRHKSVFSEADQNWIDSFARIGLSRPEKVIVLLGKDGRIFSAQQVYDALGLVDWDVFRLLTKDLRLKGALIRVRAPRDDPGGRRARTYAIRGPEVVERIRSDLFEAAASCPRVERIRQPQLLNIVAALPRGHPAKGIPAELKDAMELAGLIDGAGTPTPLMDSVWQTAQNR